LQFKVAETVKQAYQQLRDETLKEFLSACTRDLQIKQRKQNREVAYHDDDEDEVGSDTDHVEARNQTAKCSHGVHDALLLESIRHRLASAYYRTAYEQSPLNLTGHFFSFAWTVDKILCRIKKEALNRTGQLDVASRFLQRTFVDTVGESLQSILLQNQLRLVSAMLARHEMRSLIEQVIARSAPEFAVRLFGSSAVLGIFDPEESDLDFCLVSSATGMPLPMGDNAPEARKTLDRILTILRERASDDTGGGEDAWSISGKLSATVPILSGRFLLQDFKMSPAQILNQSLYDESVGRGAFDIAMRPNGVYKAILLREFILANPALLPALHTAVAWARKNNIIGHDPAPGSAVTKKHLMLCFGFVWLFICHCVEAGLAERPSCYRGHDAIREKDLSLASVAQTHDIGALAGNRDQELWSVLLKNLASKNYQRRSGEMLLSFLEKYGQPVSSHFAAPNSSSEPAEAQRCEGISMRDPISGDFVHIKGDDYTRFAVECQCFRHRIALFRADLLEAMQPDQCQAVFKVRFSFFLLCFRTGYRF
jgi:hypothetical protein